MAFFDELKKGFVDVSETISKKSGEIMEVQKLKMKKSTLESDIKKNYIQLGQIYFKHMEESGVIDDISEEYFQSIVEAKGAIDEIKVKLEQMSKDKVCSVCGEKSPKNMAYCPHCGTKFPVRKESERAEDAAEECAEAAKDAAEECVCAAKDVVEECADAVKDAAEECACAAKDVVEECTDAVKDTAEECVCAAKDAVEECACAKDATEDEDEIKES